MGYGDLFVAGVFGALVADNWKRQGVAALLTLALAGAFDCLFFFVSELPATVPVAVALIITEAWAWRSRRRAREPAGREPNAVRRRSRPAAATPRRAT